MYSIEWSRIFSRKPRNPGSPGGADQLPAPPGWRRHIPSVSPTVWALGVTSLLTDISSEMIASILPVYLVLHLGMSPLAFGVVDGIYQGAASIVRLAGGMLSDRWKRHKEVAAVGYGLSAACRLLILVAGSAWGSITAIIALDRIGKGIRTAPRDALIAKSTPTAALATAFGVHRSMDAVGAMLGPIFAFALLGFLPGAYDVLFIASFGVAVMGVGAILLFVPRSRGAQGSEEPAPIATGGTVPWHRDARMRKLICAGLFLSLGTISDSFLFLLLQQRVGLGATAFPLLYVGTSLVTSLFAVSCGRLADRHGRARVLLGGYGALIALYVLLFLPGNWTVLVACVALLGFYYAATDGVLTAMAAAILPSQSASSGLAVLATVTNLARLLGSVVFGYLWTRVSANLATLSYLVVMVAALVAASLLLDNSNRHVVQSSIPPEH